MVRLYLWTEDEEMVLASTTTFLVVMIIVIELFHVTKVALNNRMWFKVLSMLLSSATES